MRKLFDGMKNAKLEQQMRIMALSACLLPAGVWTARAAAFHATKKNGHFDSPATIKMQQSKVRITGTIVGWNGETIVAVGVKKQDTANGAGADGNLT